ncbi:MAG: tetratricopeptide repeat protein, partial [Catalinimonas sp.]
VAEVSYLMREERHDEARRALEATLARYPDDVSVLLTAGEVWESLQRTDSLRADEYLNLRRDAYRRVLAQVPDHFAANFNLGVALYNRAIHLMTEQQQDTELDALFTLLETCAALFREAMPLFEKTQSLRPEHKDSLRALEGIYHNLDEAEKLRVVRESLYSLK